MSDVSGISRRDVLRGAAALGLGGVTLPETALRPGLPDAADQMAVLPGGRRHDGSDDPRRAALPRQPGHQDAARLCRRRLRQRRPHRALQRGARRLHDPHGIGAERGARRARHQGELQEHGIRAGLRLEHRGLADLLAQGLRPQDRQGPRRALEDPARRRRQHRPRRRQPSAAHPAAGGHRHEDEHRAFLRLGAGLSAGHRRQCRHRLHRAGLGLAHRGAAEHLHLPRP